MNGKGSKRRPGDAAAYRANYDRIFRKPKRKTSPLTPGLEEMARAMNERNNA